MMLKNGQVYNNMVNNCNLYYTYNNNNFHISKLMNLSYVLLLLNSLKVVYKAYKVKNFHNQQLNFLVKCFVF